MGRRCQSEKHPLSFSVVTSIRIVFNLSLCHIQVAAVVAELGLIIALFGSLSAPVLLSVLLLVLRGCRSALPSLTLTGVSRAGDVLKLAALLGCAGAALYSAGGRGEQDHREQRAWLAVVGLQPLRPPPICCRPLYENEYQPNNSIATG